MRARPWRRGARAAAAADRWCGRSAAHLRPALHHRPTSPGGAGSSRRRGARALVGHRRHLEALLGAIDTQIGHCLPPDGLALGDGPGGGGLPPPPVRRRRCRRSVLMHAHAGAGRIPANWKFKLVRAAEPMSSVYLTCGRSSRCAVVRSATPADGGGGRLREFVVRWGRTAAAWLSNRRPPQLWFCWRCNPMPLACHRAMGSCGAPTAPP